MSRETSRGKARSGQVCKAFGISPQAYHQAKKPPQTKDPGQTKRRQERRGPWASAAELEAGIRRVVATHP